VRVARTEPFAGAFGEFGKSGEVEEAGGVGDFGAVGEVPGPGGRATPAALPRSGNTTSEHA
jgi:hypothetical protein